MKLKKQHRGTVLTIFVCILALILNLVLSWQIFRKYLSLHQQLKLDMITPGVISVSMLIPDGMTTQEAKQTFIRLTDGFEREYPGFGIDLHLYDDDEIYQQDLETSSPVVFSVTDGEEGIALSAMTGELKNSYLADMSAFENAVPLSFEIPVIYRYGIMTQTQEKTPVESADLDEELKNHTDFHELLEYPANPVFSVSSDLALMEQYPEFSGMIDVTPVSENGQIQKIYTDFLGINPGSDGNSQKIGMFWIEYLLSEEAQSILFAEHYGRFPLHEKAFDNAVMHHQQCEIFGEYKSALKGEN